MYILLYQGYTLTDQLLLCEAFTKFAYIIYHYTVVIKYAFPWDIQFYCHHTIFKLSINLFFNNNF